MDAIDTRGGDYDVRRRAPNNGSVVPGVRTGGSITDCGQWRDVPRPEGTKEADRLTLTVLIPSYNEEEGIASTLDTLLLQTVTIDRIIVIDDCSTDRTAEIANGYASVEVIRTPQNKGSKARALNHVVPQCVTDLVMVLDADTFLAPDYVEQLLPAFRDPKVTLAAGCVLSKNIRTPAERGRSIELLFSNHFYRPIQNMAGAPMVIPGCATLYRRSDIDRFGGWTSSTVCEDIDYTWVAQLNGAKTLYMPNAVVWTVDPPNGRQLGKQVNRWMSSFFQSVRLHWKEALKKPMLATWVLVCILESFMSPFMLLLPVVLPFILHMSVFSIAVLALGGQLIMFPSLAYAAIKRRLNPLTILASLIFLNYTRLFNSYYSIRAMIVELILVPLHLSHGMTVFIKGHD